eukprot:1749689-Prymnesium_polylepis.1
MPTTTSVVPNPVFKTAARRHPCAWQSFSRLQESTSTAPLSTDREPPHGRSCFGGDSLRHLSCGAWRVRAPSARS